ncbi:MAG: hypothetical protein RBT60_12395 [Candidatus Krumholzibacteria bacterium]|nr:hypothetical protein [Candidatus Krumholzibacteria bacterium]
MKKILYVTGAAAAFLVVAGILLQQIIGVRLHGIVREYDRAVADQLAARDYEAAYYQLNHLYNRVATSTSGHRHLTAEQLKTIRQKLYHRTRVLLRTLDQELPGGVAQDWTSTAELAQRYDVFFHTRIAMLVRDQSQRRMIALVGRFRGAQPGSLAYDRLPEPPRTQPTTFGGRAPAPSRSRPAVSDTECRIWRSWAQQARLAFRACEPGARFSLSSPWGPLEVTRGESLEVYIARFRPAGCEETPPPATALGGATAGR